MVQKICADSFSDSHTVKQVALIVASLGITCGGTYLISKTSKGILNKVCSLVGGSAMIVAGLAGIVLSDALLDSIQEVLEKATESSDL